MDKLERIKKLKEARKSASQENDKEVGIEKRIKRLQEVKSRSDKVLVPDHPSEKPNNPEDKSKVLNYTIEDTDKWNQKQEAKRLKKGKGFENLNQVAAMTYKKEIAELAIDKEAYKKHQQQFKHKSGDRESIHNDLGLNHKPSLEASKALVESIQESDARKMKKRRKKDDGTTDAFINQKNRDFNRKLDRQLLSKD
ncbi:hypothetical protein PSN45_002561 [Yamadazyma tenuis]|uniref:Pre-mRNA-splicing factor SYF2 n=1 Tax=Candida tenuis (strain ATCC 10573 / BCRC 21748 / CBS 615 / JCM 9827 / NBRC 10315 / NRRL Y-1498 / VKM Y-70) TaxID=590646 RepID=G3B018_CANTC|nr:uncharacterized protein CANTEDRAFT_133595 [Yamadazyma tenuis ATCC 10573]EGV65291.1 hypothetical protein CANTEDRAFT_133595 [Yamadazyma tenuis ATCC 10573]WEJ95052.1 hypothetical protein PSN45_002561 [Yamadazyma tenuis]